MSNKISRILALFFASVLLTVNIASVKVWAADADVGFYSSNNILFYNPNACSTASSTAATSNDTVVTPDKKYGTGPADAGQGHTWKTAKNATDFGGPGDNPNEGTAYSGQTFGELTKAGVFYFAVYPHHNPNTPKAIVDAFDSGKLSDGKHKGGGKLIFKGKNGKIAIGALLDAGPGNATDGTWLDLGHPLATYLGISTTDTAGKGDVSWDFLSGSDSVSSGSTSTSSSASSTGSSTATSNMPYSLPATSGYTGDEEAIDSSGHIPSGGAVTFHDLAKTGQAYQDYYITMRWNYVSWNWNGTSGGKADNKQFNWFNSKPRIVLVTNPRTKKSIYAAALEAGPAPWTGIDTQSNNNPKEGWKNPQKGTPSGYKGRVSGLPPKAIDALGAKQGMHDGSSGDVLTYQWAPDQSVTPGPTDQTAQASGGTCDNSSSSSAGEHGWDLTGAHAMVFYDQCSDPWVNDKFGFGSLCQCGCGPTSMAMIVATLTGDKSVTPKSMAAFYSSHGGQESGCGSTWNWNVVSTKYSVTVTDIGKDFTKAKATLDAGGLVLFSWSGAPFTGGGHIMVLRKYDGNKLYIASSGGHTNRAQSDEAWDQSMFENGFSGSKDGRSGSGNLKGMWSFTKK